MPTVQVETKSSQSVWKSPDGQREIFEVTLDYQGSDLKAKTYSKDISTVGWVGMVESYEKQGRNGVETFVKQPPKEFNGGSGHSTPSGTSPSSRSGYVPKDEKAIQAMWSIRQAIALLGPGLSDETMAQVHDTAVELFNMVAMVKDQKLDTIVEVPEGDITLDNIESVFGEGAQELPWPKS